MKKYGETLNSDRTTISKTKVDLTKVNQTLDLFHKTMKELEFFESEALRKLEEGRRWPS